MNKLYPIQLHRRDEKIIATTALAKLAEDPDRVNAQLRECADAYTRAINEARLARAQIRSERAHAYWRIGQAIHEFDATLRDAGFYLPAQTATFARDLGMHEGSLRKIIALHRQHPEMNSLDKTKSWRALHNKEPK